MCVTNSVVTRPALTLPVGALDLFAKGAEAAFSAAAAVAEAESQGEAEAKSGRGTERTQLLPLKKQEQDEENRCVDPQPAMTCSRKRQMAQIVPGTSKEPQTKKSTPSNPGLTAKNHQRHFVQHNYHDHADDIDNDDDTGSAFPESFSDSDSQSDDDSALRSPPRHSRRHRRQQHQQLRKGGVTVPFPEKLHHMLDKIESDGHADVVSWQPHGRAFLVHKTKEFVETIMPRYFRQSKISSFQRQLNLYGFNRLTRGRDKGAYYHELFLRGKPFLCRRMVRTRVKGTGIKASSSPETEPNFYAMLPVKRTGVPSSPVAGTPDPQEKAPPQYSGASQPPLPEEFEPLRVEVIPSSSLVATEPFVAATTQDRTDENHSRFVAPTKDSSVVTNTSYAMPGRIYANASYIPPAVGIDANPYAVAYEREAEYQFMGDTIARNAASGRNLSSITLATAAAAASASVGIQAAHSHEVRQEASDRVEVARGVLVQQPSSSEKQSVSPNDNMDDCGMRGEMVRRGSCSLSDVSLNEAEMKDEAAMDAFFANFDDLYEPSKFELAADDDACLGDMLDQIVDAY